MTALIYHPADLVLNRRALGILVLMASAIVIARDDERLDAPSEINTLMSDEIYEQATGWRGSAAAEDGWRAPEPQPRARVTLGFDSAFEEQQMRNFSYQDTRRSNLRDTTPNTQFRIDFFPQRAR